jgi:hypothetical protein
MTPARLARLGPLRRLGVLQGKAGPHRTHGGPSVPNRPWRPMCPMDPEGVEGAARPRLSGGVLGGRTAELVGRDLGYLLIVWDNFFDIRN